MTILKLLPLLFLPCFFTSFQSHGMTAYEKFLEGYKSDCEAAQAFQLIVYLEDLKYITTTSKSPQELRDSIGQKIDGFGTQPPELASALNKLKTDLLEHPQEQHILKILEEKIDQTYQALNAANIRALEHYQTAQKMNENDTLDPFVPATLFAEAGDLLINPDMGGIYPFEDKGSQTNLPLIVATLAQHGLVGLPQNSQVAMIWLYRGTINGNKEAEFHFTKKLLNGEGVNSTYHEGCLSLNTFKPQLPDILPFLNNFSGGHENIFRVCAMVVFFYVDYQFLMPFIQHYLWGINAIDHPWVHMLTSFFVGLVHTALFEYYLKHDYDYSQEHLKQMAGNHPASLVELIKEQNIRLTPTNCSLLVSSAQNNLRTWALNMYAKTDCQLQQLRLIRKSRSYDDDVSLSDSNSDSSDHS